MQSRADGLIVEVHPAPETAIRNGVQSLDLTEFVKMMRELKPNKESWRDEGKQNE